MTPFAVPATPAALWRHPAFGITLAAAGLVVLSSPLWWPTLFRALTAVEFGLAAWVGAESLNRVAWFVLPVTGFAAGLLASVSPCILPLIPIQLAAIGATGVSGRAAAGLSFRFVVGAALALTLLGLFGDAAGWLLVEQRGVTQAIVGGLLLYLGLAFLELLPLPFAGRDVAGARRLGPIGAGAAFSLVTTPCASPLLAGVLGAAAAASKPGLGAVTMLGFALGYTALVFVAGIVGGSLVLRLRAFSFAGPRAAGAALLLAIGGVLVGNGIRWL